MKKGVAGWIILLLLIAGVIVGVYFLLPKNLREAMKIGGISKIRHEDSALYYLDISEKNGTSHVLGELICYEDRCMGVKVGHLYEPLNYIAYNNETKIKAELQESLMYSIKYEGFSDKIKDKVIEEKLSDMKDIYMDSVSWYNLKFINIPKDKLESIGKVIYKYPISFKTYEGLGGACYYLVNLSGPKEGQFFGITLSLEHYSEIPEYYPFIYPNRYKFVELSDKDLFLILKNISVEANELRWYSRKGDLEGSENAVEDLSRVDLVYNKKLHSFCIISMSKRYMLCLDPKAKGHYVLVRSDKLCNAYKKLGGSRAIVISLQNVKDLEDLNNKFLEGVVQYSKEIIKELEVPGKFKVNLEELKEYMKKDLERAKQYDDVKKCESRILEYLKNKYKHGITLSPAKGIFYIYEKFDRDYKDIKNELEENGVDLDTGEVHYDIADLSFEVRFDPKTCEVKGAYIDSRHPGLNGYISSKELNEITSKITGGAGVDLYNKDSYIRYKVWVLITGELTWEDVEALKNKIDEKRERGMGVPKVFTPADIMVISLRKKGVSYMFSNVFMSEKVAEFFWNGFEKYIREKFSKYANGILNQVKKEYDSVVNSLKSYGYEKKKIKLPDVGYYEYYYNGEKSGVYYWIKDKYIVYFTDYAKVLIDLVKNKAYVYSKYTKKCETRSVKDKYLSTFKSLEGEFLLKKEGDHYVFDRKSLLDACRKSVKSEDYEWICDSIVAYPYEHMEIWLDGDKLREVKAKTKYYWYTVNLDIKVRETSKDTVESKVQEILQACQAS